MNYEARYKVLEMLLLHGPCTVEELENLFHHWVDTDADVYATLKALRDDSLVSCEDWTVWSVRSVWQESAG